MYFGSKSEKLARQIDKLEAQLEDLTAGQGAAEARGHRDKASKGPSNRGSTREPLPPHLARDEIELTPDPACPICATAMQWLGEDVSEQLARVAAAFKVTRTIRHKLCCPDCGHIEQPAMPSLPIEHSIAHPSLLADIAVSKFADHQPLYRQSEIAARDNVTLDRGSMGRWLGQIAELCMPLVEAIQRHVKVPGKVHVDDTPVAVLAPGSGKTVTGRFWVYVRDDRRSGSAEPAAVWFDFSSDRKGVHPQTRLAAFHGAYFGERDRRFRERDRFGGVGRCAVLIVDFLVSSGRVRAPRTLGFGDAFLRDFTGKRDPMMTLHEAVEHCVGDGLVADPSMPVLNR
ncbi:MAG: Transposase and inactivated derivatives [uncultured Paraburkholderia sp.]|nr:MAG: Transposase and inactivated derivatives [uncultured Paraburkholderia sp.]